MNAAPGLAQLSEVLYTLYERCKLLISSILLVYSFIPLFIQYILKTQREWYTLHWLIYISHTIYQHRGSQGRIAYLKILTNSMFIIRTKLSINYDKSITKKDYANPNNRNYNNRKYKHIKYIYYDIILMTMKHVISVSSHSLNH